MSEKYTLVCDKCLRATCWHGSLYCDDAKNAGLVRATEAQLRKLNRENPGHFISYMGHDDNPSEPILTDARVEAEITAEQSNDH